MIVPNNSHHRAGGVLCTRIANPSVGLAVSTNGCVLRQGLSPRLILLAHSAMLRARNPLLDLAKQPPPRGFRSQASCAARVAPSVWLASGNPVVTKRAPSVHTPRVPPAQAFQLRFEQLELADADTRVPGDERDSQSRFGRLLGLGQFLFRGPLFSSKPPDDELYFSPHPEKIRSRTPIPKLTEPK